MKLDKLYFVSHQLLNDTKIFGGAGEAFWNDKYQNGWTTTIDSIGVWIIAKFSVKCSATAPQGAIWDDIHCCDVIMGVMASQITSLTIVYSIVYSGPDQRKYQSSASLAFVRGIHRGPVNSSCNWPVTRNMFPFDDVIMMCRATVLMPLFAIILATQSVLVMETGCDKAIRGVIVRCFLLPSGGKLGWANVALTLNNLVITARSFSSEWKNKIRIM